MSTDLLWPDLTDASRNLFELRMGFLARVAERYSSVLEDLHAEALPVFQAGDSAALEWTLFVWCMRYHLCAPWVLVAVHETLRWWRGPDDPRPLKWEVSLLRRALEGRGEALPPFQFTSSSALTTRNRREAERHLDAEYDAAKQAYFSQLPADHYRDLRRLRRELREKRHGLQARHRQLARYQCGRLTQEETARLEHIGLRGLQKNLHKAAEELGLELRPPSRLLFDDELFRPKEG